jgi:2-methylaconitate cis-trans-isomerase PrpF
VLNDAERSVPAAFMRGGMATGLFFRPGDLPAAGPERDAVLIGAMGSPDPYAMQLDGMGRGTTSTSKCVLMSPSDRAGVDADFLFAQVAVDRPQVDWSRSCGNLAAAAALYAVEEGLVRAGRTRETALTMWQANRGEVILATVDQARGQVWLTFRASDAPGAALLPGGEAMTRLDVPGIGTLRVSMVDAANAFVIVRGADIGAPLGETRDLGAVLARAERLRRSAAEAWGLPIAGAGPRVLLVDPPQAYLDHGRQEIRATDVDVVVRTTAGARLHHALPMTAAIATAVACALPGSVVADLAGLVDSGADVRVGHLSGRSTVRAEVDRRDGRWSLVQASLELTARRLMTGEVMLPPGTSPVGVET